MKRVEMRLPARTICVLCTSRSTLGRWEEEWPMTVFKIISWSGVSQPTISFATFPETSLTFLLSASSEFDNNPQGWVRSSDNKMRACVCVAAWVRCKSWEPASVRMTERLYLYAMRTFAHCKSAKKKIESWKTPSASTSLPISSFKLYFLPLRNWLE